MYVITKFDTSLGFNVLVAACGHEFTAHADKAYHFATFGAARAALIHFAGCEIRTAPAQWSAI